MRGGLHRRRTPDAVPEARSVRPVTPVDLAVSCGRPLLAGNRLRQMLRSGILGCVNVIGR